MAQHRRTLAPWFFIALVLSNHGIAMAARINAHHQAENVLGNTVKGPNGQLRNAHETYQQMTCDELAVQMAQALGDAANRVQDHHDGTSAFSDMGAEQVRSVALLTIRVSAIADVADTKLCLPEVINSGQISEHLEHFRSAEETFVNAATSEEAKDRFHRAFSRMSAVQSDLADLHSQVLNRHVLLPNDIEIPANCPAPCNSCTREHNSWSQDTEDFRFKCIMDSGVSRPYGEGFTCEAPSPRRSNANEQKSWCEVHHWQAAAAQTVDISAKAACGARSILAPLQHGGDMSEMAVMACEKQMTGEALTQEEINELRRLDSEIDEVVSPGNLASFSLFLIVELVVTISELRLQSRSPSSLVEVDQPANAPPIAYTQGSWRCRRSILSLANGLFGAMIEIVIGIAYLAIMGTLGLLAAMSVFGADAVVATLAPHAGLSAVTMGEVLGGASAAVSNRIAQFLLNRQVVQDSLQQAGAAGAISAGATDAAVISAAQDAGAASLTGTAAQEAQTLATTVEELGGFGTQIMEYWPAVAGGLTVLGVGFGIWGLARIWHSFDSPHDCQSGYVNVGGESVCHPAMTFGEAVHADCPGPQPTEEDPTAPRNDLAFVCSRTNGGITTFVSGNCRPDRLSGF